jgi:hypothetical protein
MQIMWPRRNFSQEEESRRRILFLGSGWYLFCFINARWIRISIGFEFLDWIRIFVVRISIALSLIHEYELLTNSGFKIRFC